MKCWEPNTIHDNPDNLISRKIIYSSGSSRVGRKDKYIAAGVVE